MKKIFFILISIFTLNSFSQETNKGKVFIYWGWNRGYYSASDIHFQGNNYDFTLYHVTAHDRQTKFALDPYFAPTRITIPQTNFKIGYFFNEKYNISAGVDHMKYVMDQYQNVKINGTINNNSQFDGIYSQNETIILSPDFLTFEHTDGLNYVNIEINRFDNIINIFPDKFPIAINLTEGIGIGGLYPKTNAKLMNYKRHDAFHVAGFGLDIKAGLDVRFFNHFFFRFEAKGGYINMPDIRTTFDKSDKASQHFFFFQQNFLIGWVFNIQKSKDYSN